jgi:hypothetical protein
LAAPNAKSSTAVRGAPFADDVVGFGRDLADLCSLHRDGKVSCTRREGFEKYGGASEIANIDRAVQLAGWGSRICALEASGDVKCWGKWPSGPELSQPWPTEIPAAAGARTIAAYESKTCAVMDDHGAICWGGGYMRAPPPSPVRLAMTNAVEIGISGERICARDTAGEIDCSYVHEQGAINRVRLEDGQALRAVRMSIGESGARAILADGRVVGWDAFRNLTVASAPDGGLALVAPLGLHRASVTESFGKAVDVESAYGDGWYVADSAGSVRRHDRHPRPRVLAVPLPGRVAEVAETRELACALVDSKGIWCWPERALDPADTILPVAVEHTEKARTIAVGLRHGCAINADGTVACWGDNDYGQLGDRTLESRADARIVPGLEGVRAIALGWNHSCALDGSGRLRCWGATGSGQLVTLPPVPEDRIAVRVEGLP